MRSFCGALASRDAPHSTDADGPQTDTLRLSPLITADASMPLPQLVGIQCATAGAYGGAYDCTPLSPPQTADASTPRGRSRYRPFFAMLLPKRTALTAVNTRLAGPQLPP